MSDLTDSNADYVYAFEVATDYRTGDKLCFAACRSGLKRSDDSGVTWYNAYGTLAQEATASTLAVVVSPDYSNEPLIVAGLPGGFLRSEDNCRRWAGIVLPGPSPTVSAMVISPSFSEDGLIFASSLKDGVFCSTDRGNSWVSWNFGLLDLNVLALAISPAFSIDSTLIAGTESGIFRSTNGGRAWRELDLPSGFETVLALSFSPNYSSNGVIYAGTESSGIFRSGSSGDAWERISGESLTGTIPSICPYDNGVIIVHDGEVLISEDGNAFTLWQAEALKDVEVTTLFVTKDLNTVLAGCAGGRLMRL